MEQNNKTPNKIVETYAEDMARVLEDDKSGMIKKIIHDEEQHEIIKKNLSPESRKNRIFMLVSLLFIVFGSYTLFYFLFIKEVPTVPIERQFTPLIFNDKSTFLEVKGFKKEEIIQTIVNKVNETEVKEGGVEGIYLTEDKKIMGLRRFLETIKANFQQKVDPTLGDIFVNDNFLMGVVNGEMKNFFILIRVRSTADVFESMRAWENKMFIDLGGFFGLSISSETKNLLTKDFEDGVVDNKNSRILYDKDNKIVMMYVLADDNSVIITDSKSATHEIILRLASSQVKK